MSKPSIAERVRKVVAEQFGKTVDEITDGTTFESLGADSLDVIEATILLEQEFAVTLDEDDIGELQNVGQIIDYVEKRNG